VPPSELDTKKAQMSHLVAIASPDQATAQEVALTRPAGAGAAGGDAVHTSLDIGSEQVLRDALEDGVRAPA